jgi:hypothetical protein
MTGGGVCRPSPLSSSAIERDNAAGASNWHAGRHGVALWEPHAARIDAGRLSANTRPSQAVKIRFARRAARRIDRGETVFGTNVSPVSVHAYARRGSIVESRILSARIRASLALVDRGIRPRCGGRDTGRDSGGVSSRVSPSCEPRLTRADDACRVSAKQGLLSCVPALTWRSRGRPRASSGGALCRPRFRLRTADRT